MTYEPRNYWIERALKEGKGFVATHGNEERWLVQYHAFSAILHELLSQWSWVGTLVDFGCGSGRFTSSMVPHCKRYVGVDINPVALSEAKQANPGEEFIWLSKDRLPFDDGKISVLVAVTVFQHIVSQEDWELWTGEINRVLKPDGKVIVVDAPQSDRVDLAEHMALRSPEEMAEALDRPQATEFEVPVAGHWAGVFSR